VYYRLTLTPQSCPHPRLQFTNTKWLRQIVVGTGIQRFDFFRFAHSG
jgi:hypothetical protein